MGIDWIVFGGVILFLCLLFGYSMMLYYLFNVGDDEDSGIGQEEKTSGWNKN